MRSGGSRIRTLAGIGLLGIGLVLVGGAAAQRQHIVLVKMWNVVDPGDLTIDRGDEVLWMNTSARPFTMIFDRVPGAPDPPLVTFSEFSARFDRPGTYRYLITGMGRGGGFVPGPDRQPSIVPVAASSGLGWITVK